jgi:hypothetical protein
MFRFLVLPLLLLFSATSANLVSAGDAEQEADKKRSAREEITRRIQDLQKHLVEATQAGKQELADKLKAEIKETVKEMATRQARAAKHGVEKAVHDQTEAMEKRIRQLREEGKPELAQRLTEHLKLLLQSRGQQNELQEQKEAEQARARQRAEAEEHKAEAEKRQAEAEKHKAEAEARLEKARLDAARRSVELRANTMHKEIAELRKKGEHERAEQLNRQMTETLSALRKRTLGDKLSGRPQPKAQRPEGRESPILDLRRQVLGLQKELEAITGRMEERIERESTARDRERLEQIQRETEMRKRKLEMERQRDRELRELEMREREMQARDRRAAEMRERFGAMEREIAELHEQGKHEQAEQLERELHEAAEHHHPHGEAERREVERRERIEHLEREIAELHEHGHHQEARRLEDELHSMHREMEHRRQPGGPDAEHREQLERRLHHLRTAAENLAAIGMHDVVKRLHEEAEDIERALHAPAPGLPGRFWSASTMNSRPCTGAWTS